MIFSYVPNDCLSGSKINFHSQLAGIKCFQNLTVLWKDRLNMLKSTNLIAS